MFQGNTITNLKKKSDDALKIFKNSLTNLEETNKALRFEKAKQLEKKAQLEASLNELETIEKQNENFMSKINSLFQD